MISIEEEIKKEIKTLWPGWEIEKQIGAGSFGKVYKIRRDAYGQTYYSALKHVRIPATEQQVANLQAEGMQEETIQNYLKRIVDDCVKEIKIMAALKGGSNIVYIEDSQVIPREDGRSWDILIKMELLTTLLDRMKKGQLAEQQVFKVALDISNALIQCEKLHMIHRDIKPENVFVSAMGDYKLGDFGVARKVSDATMHMTQIGTASYMAPEVYFDRGYDQRADIYSLGILLYTLGNQNHMPFTDPYRQDITPTQRNQALHYRLHGGKLLAPSNVSSAFAQIILKACNYEPDARYSSASEMRRDLIRILPQMQSDDEQTLLLDQNDEKTLLLNRQNGEETVLMNGQSGEETVLMHEESGEETVLMHEESGEETVLMHERTGDDTYLFDQTGSGGAAQGRKLCPYCHKSIKSKDAFCMYCGRSLRANTSETASEAPGSASDSYGSTDNFPGNDGKIYVMPPDTPEKNNRLPVIIMSFSLVLLLAAAILLATTFLKKSDATGSGTATSSVKTKSVSEAANSSTEEENADTDDEEDNDDEDKDDDTDDNKGLKRKLDEETKEIIRDGDEGDIFSFGEIDTDGMVDNGDEPISWIILTRKDNKILITTEYVIEGGCFSPQNTGVKWADSDVRTWLNGDFYEKCFTNEEKEYILTTKVSDSENSNYSTSTGKDTEDEVFLLSYKQAKKYFKSDEDRRCQLTEHAKDLEGLLCNEKYGGTTWWWLRSPGKDDNYCTIVNSDGSISGDGMVIGGGGIRPAMWISTEV